jgi:hypothetical protein
VDGFTADTPLLPQASIAFGAGLGLRY